MFGATSIVNVANYLFHVVMSRALGPADYGILGVLLSMLTILSLPVVPVNMVMARYSAQFWVTDRAWAVSSFLRRSWGIAVGYGAIVTLALWLFSSQLAAWLNLPSNGLIWLLGITIITIALAAVGRGTLQGIQSYGALGVNMILEAALKLVGGVFLVQKGLGAGGAMASIGLGAGAAWVAGLIPLRSVSGLKQKDYPFFPWQEIIQYLGTVFVATLCFTALTNIDVIVARRLLPADQAGYYVAASTLSKIILYFPGAIALVVFPKSVQELALGRDGQNVVRQGVIVVTWFSAAAVVAFFLFPKQLVTMLFGKAFLAVAPMIGWLGLGMSMYGILRVLMYYLLSADNRPLPWVMLGGVIFEVCLLTLWPQTIFSLIFTVGGIGLGLTLVCLFLSLRTARNGNYSPRSAWIDKSRPEVAQDANFQRFSVNDWRS